MKSSVHPSHPRCPCCSEQKTLNVIATSEAHCQRTWMARCHKDSLSCRTTSTSTCFRIVLLLGVFPEPSSLQVLKSCIWMSPTIRSSLSLYVILVIGFGVGGPRRRQLCVLFFGVDPSPFPLTEVERLPMKGLSHVLTRCTTIGKLVVTTATNDSRMAQDPASCAPLMGS